MSICGCSYNLIFEHKTLEVTDGLRKITFFESIDDMKKLVEFPYKNVAMYGDIRYLSDFPVSEGIENPDWATMFTVE